MRSNGLMVEGATGKCVPVLLFKPGTTAQQKENTPAKPGGSASCTRSENDHENLEEMQASDSERTASHYFETYGPGGSFWSETLSYCSDVDETPENCSPTSPRNEPSAEENDM